jgi:hypothetical protein
VGELVSLTIWRAGQQLSIDVAVTRPQYLVPPSLEGLPPPYLVFAGLIFLSLSVPLLMELPQNPDLQHGQDLCGLLGQTENLPPERATDEVVVVCGTMLCDAVDEYTEQLGEHPKQVLAVNGARVSSVKQLARLLLACKDKFIRLELGNGQVG